MNINNETWHDQRPSHPPAAVRPGWLIDALIAADIAERALEEALTEEYAKPHAETDWDRLRHLSSLNDAAQAYLADMRDYWRRGQVPAHIAYAVAVAV